MKIQSLAVIFIIIILPISLLLTAYVQNQVATLELQVSYDTKLTNATYDALKAFQLNTINSETSDLTNSKIRDIQASVNSFFNSVSNQFNMAGYNESILREYVPALVYTMYDGYYIYSPFTNTLPDDTYSDGEDIYGDTNIYGIKPYIYYSCRYVNGTTDVVITYTLDNYITIQGKVNNNEVYRYGYLLENITQTSTGVQYRGVPIQEENGTLRENLIVQNSDGSYSKRQYYYTKFNGQKYYTLDGNTWYQYQDGVLDQRSEKFKINNDSAINYYKEALEFTTWVKNNLGSLRTSDAVNEEGEKIYESENWGDRQIFGDLNDSNVSIEDSDSDFNMHRLQVIRYAIEKNLSIAIANYNNYTNVTTNFLMPELSEDEWDEILNNISIISFMQGLNIGGKIYNGYSIVTNAKNKEVVSTDSIYIIADGEYHKPNDADLTEKSTISGAFLNIDFERKNVASSDGVRRYYYPHEETGCYASIVNSSNTAETGGNIYKYMEDLSRTNAGMNIAKAYFTALGRERYSMYKTNNNPEELISKFINY